MKRPKPITLKFDLDLENPKVRTWLKKKSKVEKLESITFEEIINECPEACKGFKITTLSCGAEQWHILPLTDKSKTGIFGILEKHDSINTKKILNILNEGFFPQTLVLDLLKIAQGGKLELVDGRYTQNLAPIEEQLINLQKDDSFKRYKKETDKTLNQLENAKKRARMSRHSTLSESCNPCTSTVQMVGYQALALYEYLKQNFPREQKIISDTNIYKLIAELLNERYQVKIYTRKVVKNYIENTIEHKAKKNI